MLDLEFVRHHPKEVALNAQHKGVTIDLALLLRLDRQYRELVTNIGEMRAKVKAASRAKPTVVQIKQLRAQGDKIQVLEGQAQKLLAERDALLLGVPAMVRADVPVGPDASANVVERKVGAPPRFSFPVRSYIELAQRHDLIDTDRAAKVSGARFGYLKNEAALLEFAIIQYALNRIVGKHQFVPMVPPVMISSASMRAMGYLEHGGDTETYHFPQDDLYLVGTAEQSVGPYHGNEILAAADLPLRYCAFSTCFRREAGAAGKDTRGILRSHQFDKLEMFVYCRPEESDAEHDRIVAIQEELMQGLGLAYQVVKLCTGDLGKPSARTYDIETWMPSQSAYRETHSSSTCVDFQSRRLNVRYKNLATGKNEFVHTLNGTGFAVGRILIMILEQCQQSDGTIAVPEVLQAYLGKKFIGA